MSIRGRLWLSGLVCGALLAGCERPQEEEAPQAEPAPDSPATPAEPARDTPAVVVPLTTPVPAAASSQEVPVAGIAPPVPAGATALELEDLRAVLDVPVSGVSRAELRDSFFEMRGDRVHEAMDIHAPRGTPVVSAADGRLLRLFDSRAGGLMVYAADPSERFILYYGHLDRYAAGLVNGATLTRGQVIGYVGTTGNAPPGTPHLHFGIMRGNPAASWSTGVPINPYSVLSRL